MEFIDTQTPQSPRSYYDSMKQVNDSKYWSKYSNQAASDWATMYYQNAYNTALLNYQNEYNSPLQQMLRYQEAGINPFLAQTDAGNMSSTPSGAAPRGSASGVPSSTEIASSVNQGINSLVNVLKTAQGVYDYVQYGRPLQEFNVQTSGNEMMRSRFEADSAQALARQREAEMVWSRYWNLGEESVPDGGGVSISETPRARYMQASTERISAQIDQLKSLVDVLYPSQQQANEARAALNDYQKQVLQGQNDAILMIDTGSPERDAILKQVLFWLGNKLHY